MEACQINPLTASIDQLKGTLKNYHLDKVLPADEYDKDQYLFLLMSHVVEPFLGQESAPVAVYDFPVSQASLAQVNHGVAERFEVYYRGVELANGFHELTDVDAQRKRFAEDQQIRIRQGLPQVEADHYLLQALEHGLPSCSGVALGIDRLLALTMNASSISEVISFDFNRA